MSLLTSSLRSKESAAETVGEEVAEVNTHAEDNAPSYQELDKLQSMGIAAADIAKLKSGGCHTVPSLLRWTSPLTERP